jgi:glycerate kinase
VRALVSPASLKGVLSAAEAAAALAEGLRRGGAEAHELPIADGGEGTAAVLGTQVRESLAVPDAFGRLRKVSIHDLDGVPLIEAGEVIPLDPARLDPLEATSAGLGELVRRVQHDRQLIVCLGGTATMDAGTGLLQELDDLKPETTVLCDVRTRFLDAPRVFGPQKGADEQTVAVLEDRFIDVASEDFLPYVCSRGSGAAGGLGAAFAFLGARLVQGASFVLARTRFRERAAAADLVITGEGRVDATTLLGKAPQKAAKVARAAGVRCVAFGGRVEAELEGAEMVELSGDLGRAREDLVALGERLSGQA